MVLPCLRQWELEWRLDHRSGYLITWRWKELQNKNDQSAGKSNWGVVRDVEIIQRKWKMIFLKVFFCKEKQLFRRRLTVCLKQCKCLYFGNDSNMSNSSVIFWGLKKWMLTLVKFLHKVFKFQRHIGLWFFMNFYEYSLRNRIIRLSVSIKIPMLLSLSILQYQMVRKEEHLQSVSVKENDADAFETYKSSYTADYR